MSCDHCDREVTVLGGDSEVTIHDSVDYLRPIHQLPKGVHCRLSSKLHKLNCHDNTLYKRDS